MTNTLELVKEPGGGMISPRPSSGRQPGEDRLDLAALLTVLRRRLLLFLGVWVVVVLLAITITYRQTPVYTATSQLVLDAQQAEIAPEQQLDPSLAGSDRADTEVQVLTSRELAGRVVTALDLRHDGAFNPFLQAKASLWSDLTALVGMPGRQADPAPSPADVQRTLTDIMLGALKVTRLGETRAVEIAITVPSATDAARIANEYARQYTGGQLEEKLRSKQVTTRFLSSRLEELQAQAQTDTQRVQQYRIAHNLLSTSGASLTEQEIASYNQEVASAGAQTAEDRARLSTAQAQLRDGSSGGDVGEALNSSVVSGLRARQATVSGELADLESRYGPNHPDVVRTKSELRDVNEQIQAEIGRVISNLQAKRRVSTDRLGALSGSLAGARSSLQQNNAAMAGLDDLQRRAQASQALYETYLNRYKETVASGGTERADATVVSWAERPFRPSSPKWFLNLFLGVVMGLGAGFAAAFVAEMLFSGLTTGFELEERLSLPYLAGIPSFSGISSRKREAPEHPIFESRSAFAEAFRSLRTSLHYVSPNSPQVVVVTSALPKEGKSTIVACLGSSMASDGLRVLLIDTDIVQFGLSRRLNGSKRELGLVELLNGEATLDEAIFVDEKSGAHVLALTNKKHRSGGPLFGKAMLDLIDGLRQSYDHILIDTPPLLAIADSRLVAAMADATIVVARWRHTPDHAIRAGLRLLPTRYVNVVGVVLSRIDMKGQGYIGRGDSAAYYGECKEYYA